MTSLKEELERRGWKLKRIVHFKNHDRIVLEKRDLRLSANLRGKQEDYSIEEIVSALTREG